MGHITRVFFQGKISSVFLAEYSAPLSNLTGADLLNGRAGLVIRSLTLSEYVGGVLVDVLVLVFYVLRTRLLGRIPDTTVFGEHGFVGSLLNRVINGFR